MRFEPFRLAVVSWAGSIPQIKRTWIFGSRAKQANRPDSDLDVAVELDPKTLGDEDAHTYWHYEASAMTSSLQKRVEVEIDLQLCIPNSDEYIASYVLDHGVLIYEKAS